MVDQLKAAELYASAHELAFHTPKIGSTLAGNCTTVHYGILQQARTIFGPPVEFTIGHIELRGKQHFHFSDDEVKAWREGIQKPRYNLHAWLAVGTDLIDLTLAATIYEIDPTLLPSGVTYLDRASATDYGIIYVPRLYGDRILFELGMDRFT